MHSDLLLVIIVGVALAFDFTNGFHDTANVVAAAISTRALSPRKAVTLASVLNFVGALLSLKVAATIATGIIAADHVTETIAFAALLGALAWNLITWFYGLPSSSSHALVGAVIGALLAATGGGGIRWHGLWTKVALPAVLAPLIAFASALVLIVVLYAIVGNRRPGPVNRIFRLGGLISSGALSLAHGTNDAQKTMGLIGLALVAHGDLNAQHFHVPDWVVVSAALTMGLGTWAGGWRIIRTVGTRIIKMDTAQGFTAQTVGAGVILISSHLGYPLSSTQVISGGVVGAGAGKSVSAVRWGVAGNIIGAWALTLPVAGLLGAVAYWIASAFGAGAVGPVLVTLAGAGLIAGAVRGRSRPIAGTAQA